MKPRLVRNTTSSVKLTLVRLCPYWEGCSDKSLNSVIHDFCEFHVILVRDRTNALTRGAKATCDSCGEPAVRIGKDGAYECAMTPGVGCGPKVEKVEVPGG